MAWSEGRVEIDMRAKTRTLDLRVRLKAALSSPPIGTIRRVPGSARPRFRAFILALLHVLGAPSSIDAAASRGPPRVRHSLRARIRERWLRIRGKRPVESTTLHITQKKPRWRRVVASVGDQLRITGSEKITAVESHENGFVYKDAIAMARHGVGVVSTVVVFLQVVGARGLPFLVIVVTGLAILGRAIFVNRCPSFGLRVQDLWHEATNLSISGLSLVPQVPEASLLWCYVSRSFCNFRLVGSHCTVVDSLVEAC